MDCPKCRGYVVEVTERDDEGESYDCLRCLNCGWRLNAQPAGKQIEVRKGEYFK